MLDLHLKFKSFMECETETAYELTYNGETYLIFVPHNNGMLTGWECEKVLPEEAARFVSTVIKREFYKKK